MRQPALAEPSPSGRWSWRSPFKKVVCVSDTSSQGYAARRQATLLADVDGELECITASRAPVGLLGHCRDADLVVLGACSDAPAIVERAAVPVLLARECKFGSEVTDRVLLAVDGSAGYERAAEIAAALIARHSGAVTILATPRPNDDLRRAVRATRRIVLGAADTAPQVLGELVPPERAIASAVTAVNASLVVVGRGSTPSAGGRAAMIARFAGCSVLTVPGSASEAEPQAGAAETRRASRLVAAALGRPWRT